MAANNHTSITLSEVNLIDQITSTYKLQEERRHILCYESQVDAHVYYGKILGVLTLIRQSANRGTY